MQPITEFTAQMILWGLGAIIVLGGYIATTLNNIKTELAVWNQWRSNLEEKHEENKERMELILKGLQDEHTRTRERIRHLEVVEKIRQDTLHKMSEKLDKALKIND